MILLHPPVSLRLRTGCLAAAVAASLATVASSAEAAPCSDLALNAPHVVIENGDTQEPLLKVLGQKLANSAQPLRILYVNKSTCLLAADAFQGTTIPQTTPLSYTPTAAEDPSWDPSKPSPTCDPDPDGFAIDLAIGATYLTSCKNLPAQPATVAVLEGPIQGYGFTVPAASSQTAITAEEAYFAFGFPQATGQVEPWSDEGLRFIRAATASTALTCASNIGLDPAKLQGTLLTPDRSGSVLNALGSAETPEKAIGLLGVDIYDQHRDAIKLLAFRAFGQRHAYFPDSTSTRFDKANVRDGHYVPWSPTEYIVKVDGAGALVNADVKRIVDLISGVRQDPDVDGLAAVVSRSLVPKCAMKVSRGYDGGPLSLYEDPEPCGCYFDSIAPGGASTCTQCVDDATCGAGKCRRGYCEER
jgi:hypothetical protein